MQVRGISKAQACRFAVVWNQRMHIVTVQGLVSLGRLWLCFGRIPKRGCIAGSQRVVSTSRDDTLRIWDARQDLSQLASMKHYNNTGRWVVPFRGVWGPASDTVIVGSMKRTVCNGF